MTGKAAWTKASALQPCFWICQRLLTRCLTTTYSSPYLQWFRSYLSGCSQRVVLNGHSSMESPVTSGVPQGSILDPLLFIVYINSLANLDLSPGSSIILYADNILLYRTISSSNDNAFMQQDVDFISSWIHSSGLAINPSKSSLLIISRKQVKPCVSLLINSTLNPCVEEAK